MKDRIQNGNYELTSDEFVDLLRRATEREVLLHTLLNEVERMVCGHTFPSQETVNVLYGVNSDYVPREKFERVFNLLNIER